MKKISVFLLTPALNVDATFNSGDLTNKPGFRHADAFIQHKSIFRLNAVIICSTSQSSQQHHVSATLMREAMKHVKFKE